jgi:hypothetical protein
MCDWEGVVGWVGFFSVTLAGLPGVVVVVVGVVVVVIVGEGGGEEKRG